jgi:cystathionine beta-synthase
MTVIPDYHGTQKCTWTPNLENSTKSPHHTHPRHTRPSVASSVLDLIGDTPCVCLDRISRFYDFPSNFRLFGKCEFMNPGGSVKDRIGLRMLEEAELTGRIKPGKTTLVEPTSGNTGIGLAMTAAVKGYKVIATMPEKMSGEKVNLMKLQGSEIRRTPTHKKWDDPDSHIGLAFRLESELPNAVVLDQYRNPDNPLSHYDGTAEELLNQLGDNIDFVFITAGTGGTLTGIARKFKEKSPNTKIIAIDPYGSILAVPENLNDYKRLESYQVEGIGYDFVPTVLDRNIVDEWIKTDDEESFISARDLIRYEGLLVGGSSGSALAGIKKWMANNPILDKNKEYKAAVILPDSCRNYMSKFIDDSWMTKMGFTKE